MHDSNDVSEPNDATERTGPSDDGGTIDRRDLLRAGLTGAIVVGGVGATAGVAAAETIVVDDNGNPDFDTIQGAIDAADPDDTVEVRPGTYEEDVVVDVEGLTLVGKGDAEVVGSGTSSAAVSIDANGVTVERLRVRNPGGLLGIKAESDLSGVTIRDNRVSDVGPFGSLGVSGIIAAAGQSGLNIVGNRVSGLRENSVSAQGIFLDDQDGSNSEARIAGNDVNDIRAAGGAIGILLQVSGATVKENRVRGMDGDVFAQGLNVTVSGSVDATVEFNTFENVSGERFPGEGVKIDEGDVSTLNISRNNLLPPVGLNNAVGMTVSAECNYWDSRDGPAPQGDGSEAVGDIDFTPWNISRIGQGGNAGNTCRGGE